MYAGSQLEASEPGGADVEVAVRIRPLSDAERRQGACSVVRVSRDTKSRSSLLINDQHGQGEKSFTFDRVFTPSGGADQEDVYDGIGRRMTHHALEGFNTCIFAYGQTGAGKTYTMTGDPQAEGIVPRLCHDLFEQVEGVPYNHNQMHSIKAEVSYFEIHNERVRCLLSPAGGQHRVREHPVTGPYVEGLRRAEVSEYADVHVLLTQGTAARTVAATRSNTHSSRSHAVFTITVTQSRIDVDTGHCSELVSRVNLVDLAGSERLSPGQADSDQMKEGININKSLSTLGRVINALADRARKGGGGFGEWVAYRDSVLTWLLKENLGGNSKTVMLACISPASTHAAESLDTLRYADRVKCIQNEAVVNEDHNARLIRSLKNEILNLRTRLDERDGPQSLCRALGSPQRRSSYSGKPVEGTPRGADWYVEYKAKLESSAAIVAAVEAEHAKNLLQTRQMYHDLVDGLRNQFEEGTADAPGVRVTDTAPLLVSLDPNMCCGECIAWRIKEGMTCVGPEDEPITAETVGDIRLRDGFNLTSRHCTLTRSDNVVTITPENGSLTYVDGVLLVDEIQLRHGNRVIFGSHHVFYYLDPEEAAAIRTSRREGQRPPKVLDWQYACKEFVDVMQCCRPAEEVVALRNEVDHWRCAAEGEPIGGGPCLVMQEIGRAAAAEHVSRASNPLPLVVPLQNGINRVTARSTGIPQLLGGGVFEVDVGGQVTHNPVHGAPVPLRHGSRIPVGDCIVALHCPLSMPPASHRSLSPAEAPAALPRRPGSPSPKHSRTRSSSRSTPRDQKVKGMFLAQEQLDDLRRTLHEFQFQCLEMRDVLYPPPPEDAEQDEDGAPPPSLSPEEEELLSRRERLKDDGIVAGARRGAAEEGERLVEWVRGMSRELRWLTHDFSFRLDHDAPAAFRRSGSKTEPHKRDVSHEVRSKLSDLEGEVVKHRAAASRSAMEVARLERGLNAALKRAVEAERELRRRQAPPPTQQQQQQQQQRPASLARLIGAEAEDTRAHGDAGSPPGGGGGGDSPAAANGHAPASASRRRPPAPGSRTLPSTTLSLALEHIKADLLPITPAMISVMESVAVEVRARGCKVLQRAWAHISAAVVAVGEQSPDGVWRLTSPAVLERVPTELRPRVAQSLRELAVCYDMHDVRESEQARTVFESAARNARGLSVLSAAAARWERSAGVGCGRTAPSPQRRPRSVSPRPAVRADTPHERRPAGLRSAATRSVSAGSRPGAVSSPLQRLSSARSQQSPRGASRRTPSPLLAHSVAARVYADGGSRHPTPPGAGHRGQRAPWPASTSRVSLRSPRAVQRSTSIQSPHSQQSRTHRGTSGDYSVSIGGRRSFEAPLPAAVRRPPNPTRVWTAQSPVARSHSNSAHGRESPTLPASALLRYELGGKRAATPRGHADPQKVLGRVSLSGRLSVASQEVYT